MRHAVSAPPPTRRSVVPDALIHWDHVPLVPPLAHPSRQGCSNTVTGCLRGTWRLNQAALPWRMAKARSNTRHDTTLSTP